MTRVDVRECSRFVTIVIGESRPSLNICCHQHEPCPLFQFRSLRVEGTLAIDFWFNYPIKIMVKEKLFYLPGGPKGTRRRIFHVVTVCYSHSLNFIDKNTAMKNMKVDIPELFIVGSLEM